MKQVVSEWLSPSGALSVGVSASRIQPASSNIDEIGRGGDAQLCVGPRRPLRSERPWWCPPPARPPRRAGGRGRLRRATPGSAARARPSGAGAAAREEPASASADATSIGDPRRISTRLGPSGPATLARLQQQVLLELHQRLGDPLAPSAAGPRSRPGSCRPASPGTGRRGRRGDAGPRRGVCAGRPGSRGRPVRRSLTRTGTGEAAGSPRRGVDRRASIGRKSAVLQRGDPLGQRARPRRAEVLQLLQAQRSPRRTGRSARPGAGRRAAARSAVAPAGPCGRGTRATGRGRPGTGTSGRPGTIQTVVPASARRLAAARARVAAPSRSGVRRSARW